MRAKRITVCNMPLLYHYGARTQAEKTIMCALNALSFMELVQKREKEGLPVVH